MEQSLLKILKREDNAVYEINRVEDSIEICLDQRKRIEESPFDCEAKRSDLQEYDDLIAQYRATLQLYQNNLRDVRSELRQWLRAVLEVGAGDDQTSF